MSDNGPYPGSEPFEHPEFKPSIPQHLLKGCDDHQVFILERMSVLMQQQSWSMLKLGEVHEYCRNINGKVIELEKFRQSEILRINTAEQSFKPKKWLMIASVLVIYPLYLQMIESSGLVNALKDVVSITGN